MLFWWWWELKICLTINLLLTSPDLLSYTSPVSPDEQNHYMNNIETFHRGGVLYAFTWPLESSGQVSCTTNSRGDIRADEKQCLRRRYIQNGVVKALRSFYFSVIHQCFLIFWLLWEVSVSSADVCQDQGIIFSFKGLEHMSWYLRTVRPWMMPKCIVL